MSRPPHNDIAGLDRQLLADRIAREIRDAKPQSGTAGKASPAESADATVTFPMAIPSNGASVAPEAPSTSPPVQAMVPADPTAAAGESWLQALRRRFKATEQSIHLWLYRHKYLKEEVARIRAMVEDANGRLIATTTRAEQAHVRAEHVRQEMHAELRDLAAKTNDRLTDLAAAQAAVNQKTAWELSVLQGDVAFQRRRLARLADGPADALAAETPAAAPAREPTPGVDALYVAFEERFRGPRDEIKERLRPHIARVRARRPAVPGKPLLDIGCGRGEWLELLGEAGIEAYGIDGNANTVDACRRRGLPVQQADALDHLAGLPDGALGTITIFHVIEHLTTEMLLRLLEEARRTLVPGGLLLLETPNPESFMVGASTFYTDPTHLRPIPPAVAEFLVERCGFTGVETVRLHPYPDSALVAEDSAAAHRINALVYGPQDYAVLAQRA